jgi:hypothetical protein
MKRLTRIALIVLLLVTVCYTGFAVDGVYTLNNTRLGAGISGGVADLERVKPGDEILVPEVTFDIGGVIFQGTAVPAGNAIGQPVAIQYNPAQMDGRRLLLTIGGTEVVVELYDWELIPVARFVENGYTACMTLFDRIMRNSNEEQLHKLNAEMGIRWANFHPAFGNTLIGLNLFFVDAMFVNPFLMQNTDEAFSNPVPGYHISWRNEQNITKTLRRWNLNRIYLMLKQEQDNKKYNSYIYTDYGKEISYRVENSRLVFSGVPSYLFVYNDKNNDKNTRTVTEAKELNERIIAMHDDIYALNPTVYRTAERTAQWAAFFRMVQTEYPQAWQSFIRQIAGIEAAPKFETPRYWLSWTVWE